MRGERELEPWGKHQHLQPDSSWQNREHVEKEKNPGNCATLDNEGERVNVK